MRETPNWPDPRAHIMRQRPDMAMAYFCPAILQATAHKFQTGFDGLVTYAVKANMGEEVLSNLAAAGIHTFDVASPREMQSVRATCPQAVLHYHNPVRSEEEVKAAVSMGVASYSVDSARELEKLAVVPDGTEVAVRLALPVEGAVYNFGEKFGLGPERAAALLRMVAARGFAPSITFHPGTQCTDPMAWCSYVAVAADVARVAGVKLKRLNVGGGFAAHRHGYCPDLLSVFDYIRASAVTAFGPHRPELVCEPGRAMVADAFSLAARVKAVRSDGSVFLNDGIYGGLAELRDIPPPDRIRVLGPDGQWRRSAMRKRVVFGPTCDSLDRLPERLSLPSDMTEGDYLIFAGMGAYSRALTTQFNGYGLGAPVTVATL